MVRNASAFGLILLVVGCGEQAGTGSPGSGGSRGGTPGTGGSAGGAGDRSALGAGGSTADAGGPSAGGSGAGGSTADAGDASTGGSDAGGAAGTGGVDGSAGDAGSALRWTFLGTSIGAPVQAVAIDGSGNMFAGIDPIGYAQLLDFGAAGGIFRSTDDGVSWKPSNSGMYGLTVGLLAASGTTLFAQENALVPNSTVGQISAANLVRSVDDGASWLQVTPFPLNAVNVGPNSLSTNGNLVAVGYSNGTLGISTDGANTFKTTTVAGSALAIEVEIVGSTILYSAGGATYGSVDGGSTFTRINLGTTNQVNCYGSSTCYASALDPFTTAVYPSLFKSVDAGATWTPLGMTNPTIVNPSIVAVTSMGIVYVQEGTSGQLLVRSDDGGQTWTPVTWPPDSCAFPFVAQGDKVFAPCKGGVYRSDDRAATWRAANGSGATGAISGNVSNLVVDTSPTALGADGDIYVDAPGLLRSSDEGDTWQATDPFSQLSITPVHCFVTGMSALECLDNRQGLVRSPDHGETWQTIAVTPPNTPGPMQVPVEVAQSSSSAVYVGGFQGMARSDDDGVTFQPLIGSPAISALQILRDDHVLVRSGNSTLRSVDSGVTWNSVSSFPLPVLEDASGRLIDISGATTRYSTDDGDTWTTAASIAPLPNSGGRSAIDGTGRLVVVLPPSFDYLTNLGLPSVTYTSTDNGATWTILMPRIPNPNVTGFAVDKQGRLLAATTGGLYRLDGRGP